ncbi:MAG TPA: c-type cytochrome, partial [Candidatus Obscuribacterales bacterium]
MKTSLRVALPVIVVLIAAGLAGWWGWRAKWFTDKVPPGQALYEEHCAVCHGIEGDGQGKAAYLLRPKPRNL